MLAPYKYAGYPMLIKTIQLEADDEQLFSKETSLLAAAAELTYHTINCSALNAEELRRERGLEVMYDFYLSVYSIVISAIFLYFINYKNLYFLFCSRCFKVHTTAV